jgi:hypothetical protein
MTGIVRVFCSNSCGNQVRIGKEFCKECAGEEE